jgi:YD repeat-containing protein
VIVNFNLNLYSSFAYLARIAAKGFRVLAVGLPAQLVVAQVPVHDVAPSIWVAGGGNGHIAGFRWSGGDAMEGCAAAIAAINAAIPTWNVVFHDLLYNGTNAPNRQASCQYHFASNPATVGHAQLFVESCPAGYGSGGGMGPSHFHCHRMLTVVDIYRDRPKEPPACPAMPMSLAKGNPIFPLTGVKRQDIDLGVRIGGQSLTLSYDMRSKVPGGADTRYWQVPALAAFGPLWQTSLHRSMVLQASNGQVGSAYSSVLMNRGGGAVESAGVTGFGSCNGSGGGGAGAYVSNVEPNRKINYNVSAGRLVDGRNLVEEEYDATGALRTLTQADGQRLTYTYSNAGTPISMAPALGLLLQIADAFGHTVRFTYEAGTPSGMPPRIVTVTSDDGGVIHAAYDANGNLSSLTWPDGNVRGFLYERNDLPWALTGVVDENSVRHATYAYDGDGRVTSTELASGVDRHVLQYAAGGAPRWSVSETLIGTTLCRDHQWVAPTGAKVVGPGGEINELSATTRQGMVAITAQSQPAGSGCAASSRGQNYDGDGNVVAYDDAAGNRSCFAYDTSRKLRIIELSGLTSSTTCPPDLGNYSPSGVGASVQQRIVSTQWHPDWVLRAKQAEPGKITTWIYHAQPDPFNGGTVASCAPSAALLPDGKPIAVLCKRVEQATTDSSGALRFSAPLQSGVVNRVTAWTYNQWGQVLTENGPRTDVNDTTTFTYYGNTSFTGEGSAAVGHFIGDLATATNAAGQVTQYTKYNKRGQLLESIDPNGVLTTRVYDLRQRLVSTTTNGQVTNYEHDPAGQLKRITMPDGSWLGYDYDDAHRQVAVYDHRGNRIDYVLDKTVNRINEQVADPSGNLRRQLARSIDALGRVQQTVGSE